MANNESEQNQTYEKEEKGERQQTRGDGNDEHDQNFRSLRCFCGCTSFTHEQIEEFSTMRVRTLINHETGSTLFRNFLHVEYHPDKSEVMEILECYDICDKICKKPHLIHDPDVTDELLNLCPSFTWERKINETLRTKSNKHEVVRTLNELKDECVDSVQSHNDYDRFRRKLLEKLKRRNLLMARS